MILWLLQIAVSSPDLIWSDSEGWMLFPTPSWVCIDLREKGNSLFPHLSTPHSQRRPKQMSFCHITPANCPWKNHITKLTNPSSLFNPNFHTGIWTENKTGWNRRRKKEQTYCTQLKRRVFNCPIKERWSFWVSSHPSTPRAPPVKLF